MTNILVNKFNFNFFVLVSICILTWLIVGSIFTINNTLQIAGFSLMVLAFFKPKYALYLLLFMLPLFGERPSGVQANYLVVYSSYVLFGMYANLVLDKHLIKRFLARVRINNIVLMFIYLYIAVAFLSLLGLPVLGMVNKTLSEDSLYIIKQILSVGETTLFSSVQSVLLLFQAFLFGLYVYGVSEKNKLAFYRNIIVAILAGFLFSIWY